MIFSSLINFSELFKEMILISLLNQTKIDWTSLNQNIIIYQISLNQNIIIDQISFKKSIIIDQT